MNIASEIKEIAEIVKKLGDIELYRKIVELEGQVIELTRTNRELEEKNTVLEEAGRMKERLVFKEPFYYCEKEETPYCPKCWEDDKKAVHMVLVRKGMRDMPYNCPKCKTLIVVEAE